MSERITIPKELAEKLIETQTVESLLAQIKKFEALGKKEVKRGEDIREFLLDLGVAIGYPVLNFFANQLFNLKIIGDIHPEYFSKIYHEVSTFLSLILSFVSRVRQSYEKTITEKELEIKKTEAGTGFKI